PGPACTAAAVSSAPFRPPANRAKPGVEGVENRLAGGPADLEHPPAGSRKLGVRRSSMPILRLSYATQFLIALIAIFVLWSQVGGQGHLDLVPWHLKLLLGGGAAFCVVKATAGAVAGERAWNGKTLRW